MKEKILAMLLVILGIANLLTCIPGCGKKASTTAGDGEVSRAQWIQMLTDTFYIQDSDTEEPYFKDIDKSNELFGKIQACADIGIITVDKTFEENAAVSYKEATLNLINAIGQSTVNDYLKNDKELSEKELLDFAKNKISNNVSDKENITVSDAEQALKNAADVLNNKPFVERENIKYADDVIDLREAKDVVYDEETATIKDTSKIKEKSVIILPATEQYPSGLAKKVVSISGNSVKQEDAELEDVYDTLQVSKEVSLSSADFVPAGEGITIEESSEVESMAYSETGRAYSGNGGMRLLSTSNGNAKTLASGKGVGFDVNLNLTKGKVEIDEKWNSLSGTYGGRKDEESDMPFMFDGKNLYTEKYKGGYEIKGKISLSDIMLTSDIDYKKALGVPTGINRATTKVDFKASFQFSIKGKLEGDIDILTANIPIGSGVSVKCVFMLSVGANGELSVKSEVVNTTSYIYEKGLRSVSDTNINNKASLTGELSAKVGPKAMLSIVGIDLFDVQALIGMTARAEISSELGDTEIPCVDVKVYAPIVTLKFACDNSTMVNQLGYSAQWKLYDIKGAWKKPNIITTYHWEAANGWVSACTHPKDEEGNATTAENTAPDNTGTDTAPDNVVSNNAGGGNTAPDNTTAGGNNSSSEQPNNNTNSNPADNKNNSGNGSSNNNADNNNQAGNQGEKDRPEIYCGNLGIGESYSYYYFGNMLDNMGKADSIKVKSVKINGISCEFKCCSGEEKVKNVLMKVGGYEELKRSMSEHEEFDSPMAVLFVNRRGKYNEIDMAAEPLGNGNSRYNVEIVAECAYLGETYEWTFCDRWLAWGEGSSWDWYGNLSDLDW